MNPNGEVHSPSFLVEEIYKLLIPNIENLDHIDLYEPGIGPGIFNKLYPLHNKTTYYGCEINTKYKYNYPIVCGDFFDQSLNTYDVILGNLPFNHGVVHTPCNKIMHKKSKTIWPYMLKKCIDHIKINGYGAFIIPCIWLKPDRKNIYELLTSRQILYLKTYDCKESNKIFSYQCQTPTCYVIFKNIIEINRDYKYINIYDEKDFILFKLYRDYCIPTKNLSLLKKSLEFTKKTKSLPIIKVANTKKIKETKNINDYFLIKSITLDKKLIGFYSDISGSYQNIPKVILAHKRLPIPLYDKQGIYGLYGRDIYIVIGDKLDYVYNFLSLCVIQKIIKSFDIRMNFYEKYIFDYIPDPRYCQINDYLEYIIS